MSVAYRVFHNSNFTSRASNHGAWKFAGLLTLIALLVQLPLGSSFAQAGNSPADEAQQARDRLFNQLGNSEAEILQGGTTAPEQAPGTNDAIAVPHESKIAEIEKVASNRSQGEALREALEAIRVLEVQQDSLIDELMKYKQRVQALSAGSRGEGGNSRDIEQLQKELERERSRSRDLEGQVEELKRDVQANVKSQIDSEVVAERIGKIDQISARLEQELEAKKNIAADNDYLRLEIEKYKERLQQLEARQKAQASKAPQAVPGELQNQLEKLTREKNQLELSNEEKQEKLDKDVVLLRQASEQLRKLKEQLKEKDDSLATAQSEVGKLQSQLTSAAKEADALARVEGELGETKLKSEQVTAELKKTSADLIEHRKLVADLRGQIQALEQDKSQIAATFEKLKNSAQATESELTDVRSQLAKSSEDAKLCFSQLQDKSKAANQLPEVQASLREVQGKFADSESKLNECNVKIKDKDEIISSIPALRKQLLEAKNQLLLKETESQVLTGKDGGKKPETGRAPIIDKELERQKDRVMETSGLIAGQETVKGRPVTAPTSDVLIVTVRASKASLRAGPGPEHAPVMEVGRGTTLVVESREGEWYRVIAPNSNRAYIKADLVVIVSGGSAGVNPPAARVPKKSPVRTVPPDADGTMEPFGDVKGGAPPTDSEQRAFERLKKLEQKP